MKIRLPARLTINAYERFIAKVAALTDDNDRDLEISATMKYPAFGGWACAIQAVNTWSRRSARRAVLLRPKRKQQGLAISSAAKRPHKFCATMAARSIVDAETSADIRPIVNINARNAVDRQAQSTRGLALGGLNWFVFVDHSTRGFDRNFYSEVPDQKPQPRQLSQISEIIAAMVRRSLVASGGGNQDDLTPEQIDHLGRLFYELFLNTHEHGTRGVKKSEWLVPGLRVVYANGINLSPVAAANTLADAPPLVGYLESFGPLSADRIRFVEISIVDSGLGYCGRWLADRPEAGTLRDLSTSDEYAIFKQCFAFRQTSTDNPVKGNGLPVVLERLTALSGFMRIRSGRLALYRDFVASPFFVANPPEDCEFFDWKTRRKASERVTRMPAVSGVALTLLIPVGRAS